MPISSKTRKITIAVCSSLLLAGGIFILSASPARAEGWFGIPTVSEFVNSVLGMIANVIFKMASFFVLISATLLEFVFGIEKFTGVAAVNAGWQVCRDIVNIGFVLVLLILAFDSVLQLNKYQIKTILPRLIIAALLINFSLVFCVMIIDFAQIATHYFYTAAIGSSPSGLSGQLANALNIQSVFTEPANWGDKIKQAGNDASSIIIGILFGTAILLIAAFSLAAAAIFFIYRIVRLWLLMIFAPIAWVSMIVPGAPQIGGYWGKWWVDFLKWAFFAPVYMFFIYLAIMIASSAPIASNSPAAVDQINSLISTNTSGFFANGIYKILQYIAIVLILILGLRFAQESGAAGAGMVMKMATDTGNWAKKKFVTEPAKGIYNKGAELAAKTAAINIGGRETRWSGRMRAKAEQLRQKGIAEKEQKGGNQAYSKLLGSMSEKDLLNEISGAAGIRKLIATRKANEKGLLGKCSTDEAAKAIKNLRDFGQEKEARDLEEVRFDAISDKTKQKEAIRRAKESETLSKAKVAAISNPQAMSSLQEELSPTEFTEVFKKWGKSTKLAAEQQMQAAFTDAFSDPKEIGKREIFASCTGKITEAFKNPTTGAMAPGVDIGNYVHKMTAAQMGNIYNEDDLRLIGDHITEGQASSVRNELSAKQKSQIRMGKNGGASYFMNNPTWN